MQAPDDVAALLDIVTHDLRSPIASVRTMISLLTQGYLGELQPSQGELIGRVEARLTALQALVDELADRAWLRADQDAAPGDRLELVETSTGGLDLALRFVRAAAERRGGTVRAEPTEDGGTTITIRLPASDPAAPAEPRGGQVPAR